MVPRLYPPGLHTGRFSLLDRCKVPKHRKHIEEQFERYNRNDTEGFRRAIHALSLNDTFWVKEERLGLTWQAVSLYRMDIDQLTKRRDWCIQKCQPRFGIGFIPTAKGMLTDQLRAELEQLRGFEFQQHPYISAEQKRLDILSEIVNRQIEQILL